MSAVEPDSAETLELLDRIAAGDAEAVEQLISQHRDVLRRFIEARFDALLAARVDPSDLVQETQIEVIRSLDDYLRRRPMPFRIWLRKTAYQKLAKTRRYHVARRRDVRRERISADSSSLLLSQRLVANDLDVLQTITNRDLVALVQQALAQLGETDREVLTLRIVDELSHEEIACLLDLESATIRQRFVRALLRLRGELAKSGLLEPRS